MIAVFVGVSLMNLQKNYDVIVVGGGHAGIEAALIAAKMNVSTLMLTINLDTIGLMPCNPAIGGIAKGQVVKELDALGGEMGKAIDKTGIQFRILNSNKGPAVQSSRAQADKLLYKTHMKEVTENTPNLDVKQSMVTGLIVENNKVIGVKTILNQTIYGKTVILTTGTFLNGLVHVGRSHYSAGRAGEFAAIGLTESLIENGLTVGRLKTGTTPRLDGRTIDFSKLQEQPGDEIPIPFSFYTQKITQKQVSCYITYTNEKTHDLIRGDLKDSPLFAGIIKGIGPRYCPSIEDKVVKFPDKLSHQIFLEPEGYNTVEYYPNGVSTSLPYETQIKYLRSIVGLENVEIMRPGYAIEYDYVDPRELRHSLETKKIENLYLAGQINGTSGYEEAAGQGLMAGINAALKIKGEEPFILTRDESYIGVMIDDLVTIGVDEPYRLFTSRAEHRLLLREDNTMFRLFRHAKKLNLIENNVYELILSLEEQIKYYQTFVSSNHLQPTPELEEMFLKNGWGEFKHVTSLNKFLKRSNTAFEDIKNFKLKDKINVDEIHPMVKKEVEVLTKYEGYIEREYEEIERNKKIENTKIPESLDISKLESLTREVKEKLLKHKPQTLGQAMRISGITPAAISVLLIAIKKS